MHATDGNSTRGLVSNGAAMWLEEDEAEGAEVPDGGIDPALNPANANRTEVAPPASSAPPSQLPKKKPKTCGTPGGCCLPPGHLGLCQPERIPEGQKRALRTCITIGALLEGAGF